MSIRPVDFNGMIQNTHDVSKNQQQENDKPVVSQQNIEVQIEKNAQTQLQRVRQTDESEKEETRYDAKEKGKNSYSGKKQNRKKQQQKDDKVTAKNQRYSFDVKI
ncbi:MAG: hypothetical protein HFG80_06225 [Eubacterium sp.]|nr:hypothetical protein [Eubacterium sp.]